MRRLVVVQLAIFAVIAAIVIPFGIRYVAGPQGFRTAMTLTATMTDAFGLTAGTSVTVRGVQVGTVDDVWLAPTAPRWCGWRSTRTPVSRAMRS